jgi:large subunit ribosomal protein L7e
MGKVVIPESVLKKRKRQEKYQADKDAASASAITEGKKKKAEIFKRAESYVKEYRSQEDQLVTMKRAARKAGTFYVPEEQKLVRDAASWY